MKAGDIVQGFIREGRNTKDVKPIISDRSKNGTELSLRKLSEIHGINLDGDTLVLEKKARYCTQLVKLDTKEYGLPQTRNRKVGP
jgi:hypothetical protein